VHARNGGLPSPQSGLHPVRRFPHRSGESGQRPCRGDARFISVARRFHRRWRPRVRVVLVANLPTMGSSTQARLSPRRRNSSPAPVPTMCSRHRPRRREPTRAYAVTPTRSTPSMFSSNSRPTAQKPFYDTRRVSAHLDAFMGHHRDLIPDAPLCNRASADFPKRSWRASVTTRPRYPHRGARLGHGALCWARPTRNQRSQDTLSRRVDLHDRLSRGAWRG